MNEYYHAFSIGFNWWYLVGPLMLFQAACFSAICQLRIKKRRINGVTVLSYREGSSQKYARLIVGLALLLIVIVTVTFGVLVFRESYAGLQQLCDNHTPYGESPIYACISAAVIYIVFVIGYGALAVIATLWGHKVFILPVYLYDVLAFCRIKARERISSIN